jgi:hypothetical protein
MKSTVSTLALIALLAIPAAAQTKSGAADTPEARFTAADVDKSGFLDGKELEPFKSQIAKIDTDKDGKISKQEHHMAVMTGLVK